MASDRQTRAESCGNARHCATSEITFTPCSLTVFLRVVPGAGGVHVVAHVLEILCDCAMKLGALLVAYCRLHVRRSAPLQDNIAGHTTNLLEMSCVARRQCERPRFSL